MPRDIMISVASEMSGQSPGPDERNFQLPVQVCICLRMGISLEMRGKKREKNCRLTQLQLCMEAHV